MAASVFVCGEIDAACQRAAKMVNGRAAKMVNGRAAKMVNGFGGSGGGRGVA